MKQTAVEWLYNELDKYYKMESNFKSKKEILKKAKEMEKQQIVDSNISGMEFIAVDPNKYNEDAEEYYNEKFKNK